VVDRYGPPELRRPLRGDDTLPGPGEVLVRVEAAAITAGDARLRAGRFPQGFGLPARLAVGVRGPWRRILGAGSPAGWNGSRRVSQGSASGTRSSR
jgi:NADPH:quinone reductase-like Zn-dependent oxidoreductase